MAIRRKALRLVTRGGLAGLALGGQVWAAEGPDALYRQGRYAEAEEGYAQADMDRPKDIRYRYNRGCAAFQKGDYQGASAAFSSVLRRAEDRPTVRFKAAYNLGNAAYRSGDLRSAAEAYKLALLLDPDSEDARHNLELALRALAKEKEAQKKAQEGTPGEAAGPKEGAEGPQQQDQEGEKHTKGETPSADKGSGEEASPERGPEGDLGEDRAEGETPSGRRGGNQAPEGQGAGPAAPQDLSGELRALHEAAEDGEEARTPETAAALMDRKKADALLDNIQENRSRFMRLRVPRDRRGGAPSGKDW